MGGRMTIEPITTSIAAKIEGVDICDISPEEAQAIRAALDDHGVIVFSGQKAGLEEQKRLAEVFGPLEPLPTLKFLGWEPVLVVEDIVKGRRDRPASMQWGEHQGWHTDSTFTAQVPRVAVLRPEAWLMIGHETEIPKTGDYVVRLMGEDQVIVAHGSSIEMQLPFQRLRLGRVVDQLNHERLGL